MSKHVSDEQFWARQREIEQGSAELYDKIERQQQRIKDWANRQRFNELIKPRRDQD
jgi:hypothetical protein